MLQDTGLQRWLEFQATALNVRSPGCSDFLDLMWIPRWLGNWLERDIRKLKRWSVSILEGPHGVRKQICSCKRS